MTIEHENDPAPADNRFSTLNAILIALVTVMGAIVAWRASVAGDNAGDESLAGIIATINAERTLALNRNEFYEHYGNYTSYTRYNELGNAISHDLEQGQVDETEANVLDHQMREAWDTAELYNFPRFYLNKDGSYNQEKELAELWTETTRKLDVNATPHFEDSDKSQAKSLALISVVTALAIALLLLTLTEVFEATAVKYTLEIISVVIFLGSIGFVMAIEWVWYI